MESAVLLALLCDEPLHFTQSGTTSLDTTLSPHFDALKYSTNRTKFPDCDLSFAESSYHTGWLVYYHSSHLTRSPHLHSTSSHWPCPSPALLVLRHTASVSSRSLSLQKAFRQSFPMTLLSLSETLKVYFPSVLTRTILGCVSSLSSRVLTLWTTSLSWSMRVKTLPSVSLHHPCLHPLQCFRSPLVLQVVPVKGSRPLPAHLRTA